jgi:hypothetical protein
LRSASSFASPEALDAFCSANCFASSSTFSFSSLFSFSAFWHYSRHPSIERAKGVENLSLPRHIGLRKRRTDLSEDGVVSSLHLIFGILRLLRREKARCMS